MCGFYYYARKYFTNLLEVYLGFRDGGVLS